MKLFLELKINKEDDEGNVIGTREPTEEEAKIFLSRFDCAEEAGQDKEDGGLWLLGNNELFDFSDLAPEMTLEQRVNKVKELVNADIKAGVVPETVGSFSELHDYVDANEYLPPAIPDIEFKLFAEDESGEPKNSEWTDLANQIMDKVDEWLKGGRK